MTATTLYQYDRAGHLLEESDGQGNALVDYVYLDGVPVATTQPNNGQIYYLHNDRLGTPQLATDSNQSVQWMATYQPFGATGTGPGLIVQNLRMPGQEFDVDTGFYYHNGFRDYVPGLGRYLESDPIGLGGGINTYSYVTGNPLSHTDRTGLVVAPQDEICEAEGGRLPSRNGSEGGIDAENLGPVNGLPQGEPVEAGGHCPSVYRQGTVPNPSTGWTGNQLYGQQWATDNLLTTPDYAQRYGLPDENTGQPDWVTKADIPGLYTVRSAPPSYNNSSNIGGAQEVLPNDPASVRFRWFHMPGSQ